MPRDLFGDVTSPSITLGTRRWYSVPLSFLIHSIAIAVLVVVPLMATGVLPPLEDLPTVVRVESPPLPQPPPVHRVRPPQAPVAKPDVAPLLEPTDIVDEPTFEELPATLPNDTLIGGGTIDVGTVVPPPPPVVAQQPEPPKTFRPGGIIRQPERISYVAPVYPSIALSARLQGLVIIEATIGTTGRVQDARVLRSDSPILNEAAMTAVRQWTYRPTLLNGVPVNVLMTVTVQFLLQ
jgi:protein TonB